MKLYSIETGFFKLDGGAMFGVVPKTLWQKAQPADENNLCSWAMRCLLIEDGNKLILVDNGIGDKQDSKFFSHYYLHGDATLDKSLAAQGFHRDDITDVFLTHLHFDHCGGSIRREGDKLVPAFRNAVYWSNERHWRWATEPNEREKASFLKDNILPIQSSGQLQFIGSPAAAVPPGSKGSPAASNNSAPLYPSAPAGTPIASDAPNSTHSPGSPSADTIPSLDRLDNAIIPGLSVRFANGHTDAMMLPLLEYKGRTIVFMADLLPSVAHIPLPWVMAYDMFPLTTLSERRSFWSEAAAGNYILFLEHDPINECVTLQQTDKGIRAGETFPLITV